MQIVNSHMKRVDMDLVTDMKPPKELYIEVRCIKETSGDIITEHGMINMKKNTHLYVKRSDVEHLIYQGVLVQVL